MKASRKNSLIIVFLLVLTLVGWNYNNYLNRKITPEKRANIIKTVNSYYDNLKNKNYKSALELMDYRKLDMNSDLERLKNASGYVIETSLEGNHWVIPMNGQYDYIFYDDETKDFVVQTGAAVIYNNKMWQATENVYVRKVGNEFKIVRIDTDDKYCNIRGSVMRRIK